jgi:hypothetical protein
MTNISKDIQSLQDFEINYDELIHDSRGVEYYSRILITRRIIERIYDPIGVAQFKNEKYFYGYSIPSGFD